MRRKDREVTELTKIREILTKCKVCRIAICDSEGLYIVPMSFGWELCGDNLTLFLHSAKEGRKVSSFRLGCDAAFETDCDITLREGETACRYGCCYASIIGNGRIEPVEDDTEKARALRILMKCQTGRDFDFTKTETDTVAVFKLQAEKFTCKAREK